MPSAVQERSSQESGRSPRRQKSGRPSRVVARADGRPGAGGRSSHIEDARPVRCPLVQESGRSSRRTFVQEDARPKGTFAQEEDARPARHEGRSSMQKRTFVHAEGGRSSRRGRSSQAENARPASVLEICIMQKTDMAPKRLLLRGARARAARRPSCTNLTEWRPSAPC
ncbi:hypothetical protein LR48_Vigan01g046600 [Vigna angularis]|uniref:Uncharacterized protein n=1 Tax=Phaseolus angularis TaxID=3914 RepID=A0A0L9TK96_PHAAN|nr:hypothetical protein LR48_Vigan01g046600 [Vigna angularis]